MKHVVAVVILATAFASLAKLAESVPSKGKFSPCDRRIVGCWKQ
jgi:hypothetical protein